MHDVTVRGNTGSQRWSIRRQVTSKEQVGYSAAKQSPTGKGQVGDGARGAGSKRKGTDAEHLHSKVHLRITLLYLVSSASSRSGSSCKCV